MKIRLEKGAFTPRRAHDTDAGADIFAMADGVVPAGGSAIFHTGVHVELPIGTMGDVRSKSGLMFAHDILTFGTVDEGYDGEVMVKMFNLGKEDYHVHRGNKITQIATVRVVYEPIEIVDEIKAGERGSAGFGSTGKTVNDTNRKEDKSDEDQENGDGAATASE